MVSSRIKDYYIDGRSLGLFGPNNKFRIAVFQMVSSSRFEYFIIFMIMLSSIQLAMDSPLIDPNSGQTQALLIVDIITTTIFAIECLLKIIALGFLFNGHTSYLRNVWNITDFVIIVFSILSLTPLSDALHIIKMFRVFRVFRLISRNESLQVGVHALINALPNIISIMIIMMLFFLIFGIFNVSFFKGKFFYCENLHIKIPIFDG